MVRHWGYTADREAGVFTNEVRAGLLDGFAQEVGDDDFIYPVRTACHHENGTARLRCAKDN